MKDEGSDSGSTNGNYPAPPRWKGVRALDLIHRLNERGLELCSQALTETLEHDLPELLTLHRDLWLTLDIEARGRTARVTFVMVDVRLDDVIWWRNALSMASSIDGWPSGGRLPARIAQELMHETLMFAWHAVQADAKLARSILGVSDDVSVLIAGLTMRDVREIATRHGNVVRLRWPHLSSLWGKLLAAGKNGDRDALNEAHLHFKLLHCGEIRSQNRNNAS